MRKSKYYEMKKNKNKKKLEQQKRKDMTGKSKTIDKITDGKIKKKYKEKRTWPEKRKKGKDLKTERAKERESLYKHHNDPLMDISTLMYRRRHTHYNHLAFMGMS